MTEFRSRDVSKQVFDVLIVFFLFDTYCLGLSLGLGGISFFKLS